MTDAIPAARRQRTVCEVYASNFCIDVCVLNAYCTISKYVFLAQSFVRLLTGSFALTVCMCVCLCSCASLATRITLSRAHTHSNGRAHMQSCLATCHTTISHLRLPFGMCFFKKKKKWRGKKRNNIVCGVWVRADVFDTLVCVCKCERTDGRTNERTNEWTVIHIQPWIHEMERSTHTHKAFFFTNRALRCWVLVISLWVCVFGCVCVRRAVECVYDIYRVSWAWSWVYKTKFVGWMA